MKPELLTPIGDWETLAAAIKAKADAVYFGIKTINMRTFSARNFDKTDLKKLMEMIHKNNMKGYLALNTIIYDHELEKVEEIIDEAKASKVDAIIASDFAVIKMCNKKNIEVHISTQQSVSNYETIKFFSEFSPRIVLARECTLEQIKEMIRKIKQDKLNYKGKPLQIEVFIHGSLCVSVSGRCFMSQYQERLSANRGQCQQLCRRKYRITDIENPEKEFVLDENYVLSPKDLCALPILDKLVEAGIEVFKIEGRAKGPEYVYTVTKTYKQALELIETNKFTKNKILELTKELEKVYNRGFSTNFLLGTPTNDSWNKFYGSIAKEKKVRLGKITNYFAKIKVVSILLDEQLKENDEICFTGNKTGYYKLKVKEIRFENKPVKSAKKGQEISIKLDEQIRKSDEVYLIQERNINQEEKRIEQELKKFRAHKPFKSIKNV
ncbi:U32 family peptidase [Candidatus Woesearchaeota archaeon]|nr:U32 family peptidase [Candidatus Woesearchaeota archaeon]